MPNPASGGDASLIAPRRLLESVALDQTCSLLMLGSEPLGTTRVAKRTFHGSRISTPDRSVDRSTTAPAFRGQVLCSR